MMKKLVKRAAVALLPILFKMGKDYLKNRKSKKTAY